MGLGSVVTCPRCTLWTKKSHQLRDAIRRRAFNTFIAEQSKETHMSILATLPRGSILDPEPKASGEANEALNTLAAQLEGTLTATATAGVPSGGAFQTLMFRPTIRQDIPLYCSLDLLGHYQARQLELVRHRQLPDGETDRLAATQSDGAKQHHH